MVFSCFFELSEDIVQIIVDHGSGHFVSHGSHFIVLSAIFHNMIAAILRHHLMHFT